MKTSNDKTDKGQNSGKPSHYGKSKPGNSKPKGHKGKKPSMRGKQGGKDSETKRVNFDNMREDKLPKVEADRNEPGANDISWYNSNPTLLKSAGSIPFVSVVGRAPEAYASTGINQPKRTVPGIMVLPFYPIIGTDECIAANQSFNSQYSFLVHANSRNYSYNAPDLGILELGGANVFCALGAMIRAYGISKSYEEENLYYPEAILTALGFDPASVRDNLAYFWFAINNLIDQTRQIWTPLTLSVIDRWIWMNTNLFTDAEGIKAQVYAFKQINYYAYDETTYPSGGTLVPVKIKEGDVEVEFSTLRTHTVHQWVTMVQKLIDALINSEDRGIIFGDILNAYGADKIRSMNAIPSDFRIGPVYNAEALSQVENWIPTSCRPNAIGQDVAKGTVVQCWSKPEAMDSKTESSGKKSLISLNKTAILNFHMKEQPSPEAIMVASRMMTLGVSSNSTYTLAATSVEKTGGVAPATAGTEVGMQPIIYILGRDAAGNRVYWNNPVEMCVNTESNFNSYHMRLSAFDWHPFVYYNGPTYKYTDTPINDILTIGGYNVFEAFGDFDNYTSMNIDMLTKLHVVAQYSLFGMQHT